MTEVRKKPIIISGPSGSGKSKFIAHVEKCNNDFKEAYGCTSRSKRPDDTAMYFVTREEFEYMIRNGDFIEYCEWLGNYYGVPKSELIKLDQIHLLFNVRYASAKVVKDLEPNSKMIYLLPPNKNLLLKRLEERGVEGSNRFLLGMEETIKYATEYEYLLLSYQNDMEAIYADFMDVVTQSKPCDEKRLTLAKNKDFIRNYYK